MNIIVSAGENLDSLKIITTVIASFRMIFHGFTGGATVLAYLNYLFGWSGAGWADLAALVVFLFFLYDISTLPQDTFQLLVTTTDYLPVSDPLVKDFGTGFAILSIVEVVVFEVALFIFNL